MRSKGEGVRTKATQVQCAAPRLRFPDFVGGWESVPMLSLYEFRATNNLSRDKLNYEHGDVRNIHYGDIHTKFSARFVLSNESVPYVNDGEVPLRLDPESSCVVGDMVFADASEDVDDIGKSIEIIDLNDERVLAGMHTILARRTGDELVVGFGAYLFDSTAVRKQIQREAQGAKVLGISPKRLGGVLLRYPGKHKEQQKIAYCLSSLDICIGAESCKLDALKVHKHGLMQKLFPAEGEREPRLRFPGFEAMWELVPLGNIATFIKGKGLPKSAILRSGDTPCIHYGELFTQYAEAIHEVRNRTNTFDGATLSCAEDVLMPTSDVTPSGLAKASALMLRGVILGGDILVIRPHSHDFSGEFLARSIRNAEREVLKLVSGSTVFHLYASSMAKFVVAICGKGEQKEISACLSTLDTLIDAQSRKIAMLQQHKKGLKHGLFPALDAHTA